jgi:hypothetical protein
VRSFTSYSPHYCSLYYRLDPDALPFEANLLACRPAVDPPTYLLSQLTVGETASSRSAADRYDFRTVLPQVEAQTGQGGWRLLSKWPELHKGGATTMDEAQAAALRVALTKEVAIVAGGTGRVSDGAPLSQPHSHTATQLSFPFPPPQDRRRGSSTSRV